MADAAAGRAAVKLTVLALSLVELHGPSGQIIEINPVEVSSVRAPIDTPGHWGSGTRCVIVMTNGKSNAIKEDCATVLRVLKTRD
jgi:hypothetical protein